MIFERSDAFWKFPPEHFAIGERYVEIETQPHTDLWQRTYYGFRNDNAPMLLVPVEEKYFSFWVRCDFDSKRRFDQCGVCVYQDSDNWLKASIEYENEEIQRLGSVVTNNGYSDWATVDIPAQTRHMYYRLSRRESDFCIENSLDGVHYSQMRIAHLFAGADSVNLGVYACSPEDSSFRACFSAINLTDCRWLPHE